MKKYVATYFKEKKDGGWVNSPCTASYTFEVKDDDVAFKKAVAYEELSEREYAMIYGLMNLREIGEDLFDKEKITEVKKNLEKIKTSKLEEMCNFEHF